MPSYECNPEIHFSNVMPMFIIAYTLSFLRVGESRTRGYKFKVREE